MNCQHCQKTLPEKYGATYCPYCGGDVQPEESDVTEPSLAPIKISWWITFGALLAPPLLTLITAFLLHGHGNEELSAVISMMGGTAGGIAFGIILALRLGRSVGTRIGLGILFSTIFAVVCITLSCFGCLIGGYQLRFQ
jgi:hypothetical protein